MESNTAVRSTAEAEHGFSSVETAIALAEAREALKGYETSALADVAAMLAHTAESLARAARDIRETGYDEWMDADQAAAYLKRTTRAFKNIVAAGDIPKHYLTERGILFSRKELDEWLINR